MLTQYVQERGNRLEMLSRKQNPQTGMAAVTVTLEELYESQKMVSAIPVSCEIDELMDDILCELRKQGIHVSDRKFFGYQSIAKAEAFLSGADKVIPSHLRALTPYFWNKPEEITVISEVLKRFCENPISEKLKVITDDAAESFTQFESTDNKKKALVKLRNEYIRLFDLENGANPEQRMQTENVRSLIEGLSKQAADTSGNTYIPLNELKELSK